MYRLHDALLIRNALRKWTTAWQRTPESNLEPMDPNGPLPFTSTTLLSLAYIRNCSNFGSARALISWDPVQIATSLRSVPPLNRNRNVLLAALHSTHVLSTLVKLGVEYIRNTQAFTWSIEDALCGLECAIFLNKWILGIGETIHKRPLSGMYQVLHPSVTLTCTSLSCPLSSFCLLLQWSNELQCANFIW